MIKISGKKTVFKPFLKDVVEFLFSELDLSHRGIEVNLRIKPQRQTNSDLKCFGFTAPSLAKRRGKVVRVYDIFLDENTGIALMVKHIAHELIHVRQLEHSRLIFDVDTLSLTWSELNFSISMEDVNKIDNIEEYKRLPWENEAYSISENLFTTCKAKFSDAEYDLGGITTTIF